MRKPSATSVIDTGPPPARVGTSTDAALQRSSPSDVVAGAPHCLVVSQLARNGNWLRQSATSVGWFAVVHRDPLEALRESVRRRFHLAVVDASQSRSLGDFEQLAIDLQSGHVPLIVVCGPNDDEAVEIRMRRLGVWSYLPGIDMARDLTELFMSAREAAVRIDPSLRRLEADQTGEERARNEYG